ncbi:Lipopolysaccharide biosynthesis regulator YciM [Methylocaldum szegediense]|uniref:Lipopolysaccharide biosynthesis regulator YciM n=2 Tax=Methylocaldum szegediense TaxID=73780 RepID=A0ABN8X9G6_9GAMM|nr:Lipopolysaccharide biosynthesis regulator YciM [Methylocaldum szegediense]
MLIRVFAFLGFSLAVTVFLTGCGGAEERKAEYLERGRKYFEERNFEKAKVEFKNVLQIDPKMAKPYFYLGQIAEAQKDWREALGFYQKAGELDPNDLEVRVRMAKLYLLGKQIDKADALVNAVLGVKPGDIDARLVKAGLSSLKGDIAAAIEELGRITAEQPSRAEAFLILAMLHTQQNRLDEAEVVLEQGLAANPDDAEMQLGLARLAVQMKKLEKAEAIYKGMVSADPANLWHRKRLAEFYVQQERRDDAERVYREAIEASPGDSRRYILLAEFLAKSGKSDEAVAELSNAIGIYPNATDLRFAMAKLREQRREIDRAAQIYREIVASNKYAPDALKAKIRLAVLALAEGHLSRASALADEVLEANPGDRQGLMLRGRIALVRKDSQKAVAAFRSLLREQPDSWEILHLLAVAHKLDGKPALAQESLERAVAANPDEFKAYKNLVDYLTEQKNHSLALEKLDEFLKRHPEHREKLEALVLKSEVLAAAGNSREQEAVLKQIKAELPENPSGSFLLGRFYRSQKKYDLALAEYEESLSKSRDDYEILKAILGVYVERGEAEKGVERITRVLSADPKHAGAYQLLGSYYLGEKQEIEAVRFLNLAIQSNPRWLLPYANLGAYYEQTGRRDLALKTYRRALAALPGEPSVLMNLARVYELSKDYENAIEQYETLLNSSPGNLLARNNLASLLSLDHSKQDLERALELARDFDQTEEPVLWDTLAWIYYRKGEYEKALPLQLKVVEKSPGVPIYHYHLGMIYLKKGERAVAAEHLQKAVDSGKDFAGLEEARSALTLVTEGG